MKSEAWIEVMCNIRVKATMESCVELDELDISFIWLETIASC